MHARTIAFLLVGLLPATALAGDLLWREADPSIVPPSRTRGAMAYFEEDDQVVLWGGIDSNNTVFGGTWLWDGDDWEEYFDSYGPPGRADPAMAPYPSNREVVMFGGFGFPDSSATTAVSLNDTWVWDNGWSPRSSSTAIEPRWGHAMVYDAGRDRIVLFGGFNDDSGTGTFYGFTWAFNGFDWETVSQDTSNAPTARAWHAMAYDAKRDVVVLFGGFDYNGNEMSDTWEWDGSSWTLSGASGPSGRTRASMHYDDEREAVVLHGGWQTLFDPPVFLSDTWEFDGGDWNEVESDDPPSARAGHAVAYHAGSGRAVLHGGSANNNAPPTLYDDTWEIFAQRSHYGCNCRGSSGAPWALVGLLALWRRRRR